MQILIVGDDRRLARQLKKVLDELGHAPLLAFEGHEGLESACGSSVQIGLEPVELR